MIDPADQKASDEAIKRNTNLTPTEVRQSLNATAIDFQRRVDSAASITPTVSSPSIPAEITSRETKLEGQPITLPTENENQNPFLGSTGGGGISADITVCVSDGVSPPTFTQMTAHFVNGLLTSID